MLLSSLRDNWAAGRIGKLILARAGDLDVADDGASHRINALEETARAATERVERRYQRRLDRVDRKLVTAQGPVSRVGTRRERRNERLQVEIDLDEAWRTEGVERLLAIVPLSPFQRRTVLAALALLDFNVFANAYAVVIDEPDFSYAWFIGGLIGVAVFGLALLLAHQVKSRQLARVQHDLLRQAAEHLRVLSSPLEKLKPSGSSTIQLSLSAGTFSLMLGGGSWIRIEGAATAQGSAVLMLAMVPIVAFVVELLLTNPLHHELAAPGLAERLLMRRVVRLERKSTVIAQRMKAAIFRTETRMRLEKTFLVSTLLDEGFDIESEAVTRAPAPSRHDMPEERRFPSDAALGTTSSRS